MARDVELERPVALKEIQEHLADDPVFRARFLREARITGGLEHPGVVPVYSLG
jgi:serine/threonine protein kinase